MITPKYGIHKAEDPQAYKKLAEQGMMIAHPVKIAGQTKRKDIDLPYHSSVKVFDPSRDKSSEAHSIAQRLDMVPPNPKETRIEPGILKDRFGNDVHVLHLHGPHADKLVEHHKKFSHMGLPEKFEYKPHITVDKEMWNRVRNSGAKTAHEAGIEFGPAQLMQGHKVLGSYHPKSGKIQKSESYKESALNGMDLMFPVEIDSQEDRNNGIGLHVTIKLFDPENDDVDQINNIAKRLELIPPNPNNTDIEPSTIEGKEQKHYILKLSGPTVDRIASYYQEFKNVGKPMDKEFTPHITIDKEMWSKFVKKVKDGKINAKEAGIKFMPAVLKRGEDTLFEYKPQKEKLPPSKQDEIEEIKKSEIVITDEIIRDAIKMDWDINKSHAKAIALPNEFLKNYLKDNPELEKSVIDSYHKRVIKHFGSDKKLINIALKKGIKEAYKAKRK